MKLKTCKCGCGVKFAPMNSMQIAATPECAVRIVSKRREKQQATYAREERKKLATRRQSAKTRQDWMREAQAAVNAYVRERDKDLPCISCGRFHTGQWHAGHYKPRGPNPELALDERNIHKQCAPCNSHLSGNLIEYRKGLILRHGIELVEWLEGPHDPKKYTVDELKDIRDKYKLMLKQRKLNFCS